MKRYAVWEGVVRNSQCRIMSAPSKKDKDQYTLEVEIYNEDKDKWCRPIKEVELYILKFALLHVYQKVEYISSLLGEVFNNFD